MKKLYTFILLVFLALNLQAQSWFPVGTGTNQTVYCLFNDTVNNLLYAGGGFTTAGSNVADHIATWDGTIWSPVGTGINGGVWALTIYNGQLCAGGNFSTAGGTSVNNIASWDGTTWSQLGAGVNGNINAMAVYNGELYAGGLFTTAGGNAANYIAKWDGLNWSAVGTGMGNYVRAMAVYNGELYVGGDFSNAGGISANFLAKWNGTNWSAVGTGIYNDLTGNNKVTALTVTNGELYIAGNFISAGSVSATDIVKWNGTTWSALGSGLYYFGSIATPLVFAVCGYNGEIYAGGDFDDAGGISVNYVARWNGTAWSQCGTGMGGTYHLIYALCGYSGSLYAGGNFTTAGGVSVNNMARWNSTLGIIEVPESNSVTIYPNPFNTIAYIEIKNSGDIGEMNLEVYDLVGQEVKNVKNTSSQRITIDRDNLTSGIYFYKLTQNKKVISTGKLIAE